MTPLTVKMSLSTSVNVIKIISSGHVQRPISQTMLYSAKLKRNHHTVPDMHSLPGSLIQSHMVGYTITVMPLLYKWAHLAWQASILMHRFYCWVRPSMAFLCLQRTWSRMAWWGLSSMDEASIIFPVWFFICSVTKMYSVFSNTASTSSSRATKSTGNKLDCLGDFLGIHDQYSIGKYLIPGTGTHCFGRDIIYPCWISPFKLFKL